MADGGLPTPQPPSIISPPVPLFLPMQLPAPLAQLEIPPKQPIL